VSSVLQTGAMTTDGDAGDPGQRPDRIDHIDHSERDWWHTAVVYQVYIRSFLDSDGDGVGDVEGLRAGLRHIMELGADAVWVNPWYPSPQVDAGYDVADYRDIEPTYGTLAQAERFIEEAHALGLRVILDIVPNHTSDQHAWFRAALAGDRAARARYHFRPGRGPDGAEPPNDWHSTFGGSAWTRTPSGDWYLHLFAPEQPDLDWSNPEVREEFEDVLRFWFDRGADGFRIDVAHGLTKEEGLPDAGDREPDVLDLEPHPAWDQDSVHEIYRGWRRVADSYEPPRVFVAEAWVHANERLARYLRPDELHTAFQFDFLMTPFRADHMHRVIDDARRTADEVDAPITWVLSNHDVTRHVTRYARSQPDHAVGNAWERHRWSAEEPDLQLGLRRARAALLLLLALPGSVYLYQGEELGLPEVEDLPDASRQDPWFEQSGRADVGRDGCRVPLPWSGQSPPYGFSPPGSGATWLPQPDGWEALTVAAQDDDRDSTLALYRRAIRLRKELWRLDQDVAWLSAPECVLAFRRGSTQCWVNTGAADVALPPGEVLIGSEPGLEVLSPASAVWVRD
jgi:alpha-glucosidase